MKRNWQWILAGLAGAIVIVAVVAGAYRLHGTGDEPPEHADKESQKPAVTEISEPVVHLDKDSEAVSGIRTVELQRAEGRTETQAAAVVLAPQELLDLRTSYLTAVVQVEKARASANASQLEYQRLSQLNKEDQNASDRAVQAAEATYRSDAATLENAEQALSLAVLPAEQRWGSVVSKWIASDAPSLHDVFQGRAYLLQVTLPSGTKAGRRLLLEAGQRTAYATFVSAFPHVDPRFQAPSYLYITQAEPELAPGMNVIALASGGTEHAGVILPRDAVLSWQGKSWVYVEAESGTFKRTEVVLDTPLQNGWFIRQGLKPGEHVVITGGQQLLSQEFRSQTPQEDND